jgi:hypothetical protein
MKIGFGGADDWVLLSVVHAGRGGPADLRWIIACGDWINHAIFNYEEVRGGLSRLLRGGLVRQSSKGWAASRAAARAASVRGRGFSKQFDALNALMDKTKPRAKSPRLKGVTPKTFEAAVQAYLKGFDR